MDHQSIYWKKKPKSEINQSEERTNGSEKIHTAANTQFHRIFDFAPPKPRPSEPPHRSLELNRATVFPAGPLPSSASKPTLRRRIPAYFASFLRAGGAALDADEDGGGSETRPSANFGASGFVPNGFGCRRRSEEDEDAPKAERLRRTVTRFLEAAPPPAAAVAGGEWR